MKVVYSHPNLAVVTQVQASLQQAGIESTVRNEYAAGASGELAPIDAWVELFVVRDRDYARAMTVIEGLQREPEGGEWHCDDCGQSSPATFELCSACGERVEQTFELCWNCGRAVEAE